MGRARSGVVTKFPGIPYVLLAPAREGHSAPSYEWQAGFTFWIDSCQLLPENLPCPVGVVKNGRFWLACFG